MSVFETESAPLRHELVVHCYRMLGSADDAEDAVQETLLRGWRAWDSFEGRSSTRTWLYRIATRVCLDVLRERRAHPVVGLEHADADAPAIQPFPGSGDGLRLAFIAALQTLSPGQRAVLVLRDVLGYSTAETAALLDLTEGAVKSALQRARSRAALQSGSRDDLAEPTGATARRALDAYVTAFEAGDIAGLVGMLRDDTVLELRPAGGSFAGKDACTAVLRSAAGEPGEWRMRRTVANDQPAAVAHRHGRPFGVAVLDVRADGIARITVFAAVELVARFGDASS